MTSMPPMAFSLEPIWWHSAFCEFGMFSYSVHRLVSSQSCLVSAVTASAVCGMVVMVWWPLRWLREQSNAGWQYFQLVSGAKENHLRVVVPPAYSALRRLCVFF